MADLADLADLFAVQDADDAAPNESLAAEQEAAELEVEAESGFLAGELLGKCLPDFRMPQIEQVCDVDDQDDGAGFGGMITRMESSDLDVSLWMNVCVLVVPDESRFPVPAKFAENRVAVDLSTLAEMAGGDIRRLIDPSLPDDQLFEILAAEKVREKPRGIVLNAIAAEQLARGPAYSQWLEDCLSNPLCVRIAAIAWQVGDGPVISDAPASDAEERLSLAEFRDAWVSHCRDSGFDRLASWDLDHCMRVITARMSALGDLRGGAFRPCLPISGNAWRDYSRESRGIAGAAAAFGVSQSEIPMLPGDMDVFREFRQRPGSVRLGDWAAELLTLEREVLLIVRWLW